MPARTDKPETGGLLVGLFGSPADLVAVRLSERLAGDKPLQLARILDIPRDRSLPESLADQDDREKRRLRLGRSSHASLQLTCCRNPGNQLLEIASVRQPDLIVVAQPRPAGDAHLALLRWILHESKTDILLVDTGSDAAETNINALTRIVLATPLGCVWPRNVLVDAARLAGSHGTIEVAGILVVPRSLPTDAPLAEEEAALEATMRETVLGLTGAGARTRSQVIRARELSEAISRLQADSSTGGAILMEISQGAENDEAILARAQQPGRGVHLFRRVKPT